MNLTVSVSASSVKCSDNNMKRIDFAKPRLLGRSRQMNQGIISCGLVLMKRSGLISLRTRHQELCGHKTQGGKRWVIFAYESLAL